MEKRRKVMIYALIEVIGFLILMMPVFVNGYYSIQSRPVIPPNTPAELTLLDVYNVDSNISDALIPYEPDGVTLQIQCSNITSVGGDWYGSNPTIEVEGRNVLAVSVPDKVDLIWESGYSDYRESQDVNPSLTTRIPIAANDVHQTLHIHVSMDVTYPRYTGETKRQGNTIYYFYREPTATVTRDLNLFVLTPQEMQLKEDLSYQSTTLAIFSGNNLGYVILAFLWLCPFGIVISALTVASIERRQKRLVNASVDSPIAQDKKRERTTMKQILIYSIVGFGFFSVITVGTSLNIWFGPSINSAGGTFNYVCCFAVVVVVAIGMLGGPKAGAAFGQASLIPFFLAQYAYRLGLWGMLCFGLMSCFVFVLFGFLPSKVFRATKNLGLLAISYVGTVVVGFVSFYLFYTNWQSIPFDPASHYPSGLLTFFFESAANSMVFPTILTLIMGGAVVWACALSIDRSNSSSTGTS
jgi:hypothetical protein